MGTLITTHWISLDGHVSGPDDGMDWIRSDKDMENYEIALVESARTLLLGRGTYSDFSSYWPAVARDADAEPWQRRYAQTLDRLDKVVATRTGAATPWGPARSIPDLTAQTIAPLREVDGTTVIYGSVTVVRELVRRGLVDEVHLLQHPLMLGAGTRLFDSRTAFEPVGASTFASGVRLIKLRPAR